jgi:hypothetical protein
MSFFARLNFWQKGFVGGFLFTFAVGLIYTGVLIVFEIILQGKGIPHSCYMVTKTVQCGFAEAISSRFGFLVIFLLVFGIPIACIGAMIGYMVDRIRIKE